MRQLPRHFEFLKRLLDTRSKIMAESEARERLEGRPTCWISGHFDPLLAEHVRLLQKWASPGRALAVEVTNPAKPLLSQRARAELVAALAMVDCVVLSNGAGQPAQDPEISERFVKHVLERCAG
jgi:bifunctional ADP-heptose synthase (sugar kinase/adenylyltransferase)